MRAAGPGQAKTGPVTSVEIRPGDRLSNLFDALSVLGFFLESATPLPGPEAETNGLGAEPPSPIQALEFSPRWGPYADLGPVVCDLAPTEERLEVGIRLTDGADESGGPESPDRPAGHDGRLTIRDTDRYAVRADLEALLETF